MQADVTPSGQTNLEQIKHLNKALKLRVYCMEK